MKTFGTMMMCILFFFIFVGGLTIQSDITEKYRRSHFYHWQHQALEPNRVGILVVSHAKPSGKGAVFASDDKFFVNLALTDNIESTKQMVDKNERSYFEVYKQKVLMAKSNIPFEANQKIFLPVKNIQLLIADDKRNKPIYYFFGGTDSDGKIITTGMLPSDNQQSDKKWFFGVMLFSIGFSIWGIWMLKKALDKTLKMPNVSILTTKLGVTIQMVFMALLGLSAILKLPIAF